MKKEKASEIATFHFAPSKRQGFWGEKKKKQTQKPKQNYCVIILKGCFIMQFLISNDWFSNRASVKFVDRTICFLKPQFHQNGNDHKEVLIFLTFLGWGGEGNTFHPIFTFSKLNFSCDFFFLSCLIIYKTKYEWQNQWNNKYTFITEFQNYRVYHSNTLKSGGHSQN